MKRWQQTRHVLGSDGVVTLVMNDDSPLAASEVFRAVWDRIAAFEQRFSRFLLTSELSAFNRAAGTRVAVSAAMHALLIVAKQMSERTTGLYNPFILPALQRAGYVGSWPTPAERGRAPSYMAGHVVDGAQLEIGDTWARIPAGTALDFGGIGKGYLLDELAAFLQRQELGGFWCSLGGDIICGGEDLDHALWRIGVQHATQADKSVATFANNGGLMAIATSGITKRKGEHNGRAWHHLIDPRTGDPADTDILTATVRTTQACDADVFAKCLVLSGSQQAPRAAKEYGITAAVLQVQAAEHISIVSIGDTP